MDWQDGAIQGVEVTELNVHKDERGHLAELFRLDEISLAPTMGYWSETRPGVVRGPHEHEYQTDVFVFFRNFEVYLWDAREKSSTVGTRQKVVVEDVPTRVIVPPGVVHGYQCMIHYGKPGISLNFPDRLYAGPGKEQPVDEIRHENNPDSPYILW